LALLTSTALRHKLRAKWGVPMSKHHFRIFFPILIVLIMLTSAALLRADVTGSILGVVHDRSQAVVAGAKVVATNVETNLSQETTSSADGSYRILALPAGKYKLSATGTGFRQFVATDIEVKVNDQLRIDITLDVGSVQQEVFITANAVQVETESTQLGDVIDSKKMLALPLNGRSYIDLLGLQAGVVPVTSGSMQQDRPVSGILSSGNLSVNGQRETANAFLVNGGDVSEGRNLGAGLIPNLDSIEEFRLITNSFDAEYGKFSGAVMNAITKSGTNGFHGDVFEFLRNDKFDAHNFFDPTKAELRRNQFGYAVGGPFWKNKLFWFTDYQGTRQVTGASSGQVQVPTQAQRGGVFSPSDLSGTVQSNPCPPGATCGSNWEQELTARLGYTVTAGEAYSFPGCSSTDPATGCVFPGGVIPKAAWAKPAVGILPYIPVGNLDPVNGLFADASQRNTVRDDKVGQRVDFNNQTTGNWSWYYHFDDSNVLDPFSSGASSVPGFPSVTPTRAQQFAMSNSKPLGPTAVNQFRVSFFRTATVTNKPTGSFAKLSDLGFVTGAGTLGINPSGPPGFPQTVPPEYFNNFSIGVNTLTTFQPNNTWHFSDGYSTVTGRHTLKFGGEFRYLQINERNTCAPNGDFTFDGSETGSDFADFLIGAAAGFNQCSQQFLDSRTRYGGAYGEDTYKVNPQLTLNLGLRWEVSMPWYDTQGKIETFVKGLQSTQFPTAPQSWVVPGDPGIPSTLAPTRYSNFAPRLGLAYSPGFTDGAMRRIFGGPGKTSIRASYGIYYTSIEDLNLFYEVGDAPFGLYWQSPNPTEFDLPYQTRLDGSSQNQRFPFTFPVPGSAANKTLDYSVYLPISFSPGYDTHNRMPYAEHYNLAIQRELSRSTVLTLAYVGTQGHKLIAQYGADPGDPALCLSLSTPADVAPGSPTCGPHGENQVYTRADGTVFYGTRHAFGSNYCPNSPTLTCFSQANTITANIANSNYNAGQITVERKAADLTFLAAYTFSKGIDNSSGFNQWVNSTDPRISRSLSQYDITHNFVVSYIWAMPFDSAFGRLPKRLTQGWTMNGITRFAGGLPVQLRQSGDVSLVGEGSTDVPDLVGPVVKVDPRKPNPNCASFDPNTPGSGTGCYFLSQAFASGPKGGFGNANRQFFHGPGLNNTDFGLAKRTPIKESVAFEIRFEFFNIFNHTQFNNPSGAFHCSLSDPTCSVNKFGQFGQVTSARDPRIGQLSAKFYW
jgi:Carboxypeptidase regulatory-like domain/TonB dependent receptor